MKDIYQIRLENLRSLVHKAGSRRALAERLEMQYVLLSSYIGKSQTKNIGGQTARLVERVFNLEYGWMDNNHEMPALTWPFKAIDRELVAALDSFDQGKLEAAILLSALSLQIPLQNTDKPESTQP